MSVSSSATLNWVKPLGPDGQLEPVAGIQGAKVRVFARSVWTSTAPTQFVVWERAWFDRLARKLRLSQPSEHLAVAETVGNKSTSEGWQVSPPDFPGQAFYYFEDGTIEPNRSSLIGVTSTEFASEAIGASVGGSFVQAGPIGLEVSIPARVQGAVQVIHRLSAAIDPAVDVTLLVPWGEESSNLRVAALDWLRPRGVLLPPKSAGPGELGVRHSVDSLDDLSDGFLSANASGWRIWLADGNELGERRVSLGPVDRLEVVVNINVPTVGRACYALRLTDATNPLKTVVGTVVEVEATDTALRVSDGSTDAGALMRLEGMASTPADPVREPA